MKTKEQLEEEIERLTKKLIGWEGNIIIEIKGEKFNVIENHNKFVEITNLDRNKAKLQQHNEDLKMFGEEQKRKVEKLKRFVNGRNGEDENGESKECICDICQIAREIDKIFKK